MIWSRECGTTVSPTWKSGRLNLIWSVMIERPSRQRLHCISGQAGNRQQTKILRLCHQLTPPVVAGFAWGMGALFQLQFTDSEIAKRPQLSYQPSTVTQHGLRSVLRRALNETTNRSACWSHASFLSKLVSFRLHLQYAISKELGLGGAVISQQAGDAGVAGD